MGASAGFPLRSGLTTLRGRSLAVAAIAGLALLASTSARALEAFDGRIQVHGFGEIQLRALDEKFEQQLDLSQWYNIVNVEIELDLLPDGWGPFDLMSAYVRVEGRYDCVYSHGCWMFPSVNTYGDHADRIPDRLTDARTSDYAGVVDIGERTYQVNPENHAQTLEDERLKADPTLVDFEGIPLNGQVIEGTGFLPGLKENYGPDAVPNTADDPFNYTMSQYLDYVFTFKNVRGPDGGGGQIAGLGPWLPKNFINPLGELRDKANPLRGRRTAAFGPASPNVIVATPFSRPGFVRYHESDPRQNPGPGGAIPGAPLDAGVNDPRSPYNRGGSQVTDPASGAIAGVGPGPDPVPQELVQFLPPGASSVGGIPNLLPGLVIPNTQTFGTSVLTGVGGVRGILTEQARETLVNPNVFESPPPVFGGDYVPTTPCIDPDPTTGAFQGLLTGAQSRNGCLPNSNLRAAGGTGELPLTPSPDWSNLRPREDWDPKVAQGLYIPSAGLLNYMNNGGDFDSLDLNFREAEREWNRGASQQDTKELKEAYVEAEFLDSRLWTRIGLQSIVWGKTELFRTTDQFNPTDLALNSIGSLEETRINLNAARFIYSLYDLLDPLEDMRVEVAFNFDDIQPSDLGACGEAYTIDIVCGLTLGTWAHSYAGIGVAGINRPAPPWKDLGGFEIGARLEWRWDRFSFAMIDFYGYEDTPSIQSIMTFERNVDVATGRPLVSRLSPDRPTGTCANATIVNNRTGITTPGLAADTPESLLAVTPLGIGTDPNCLKFGTPLTGRGFNNAQQNALENHYANLQLFAFACSATVGIAAALDPQGCAATLFTSRRPLNSLVRASFSSTVAAVTAGDYESQGLLGIIANNLGSAIFFPVPIAPINRDFNDGVIGTYFGSPLSDPNIMGSSSQFGYRIQPASNQFFNQGQVGGNLVNKLLPSWNDFITLDSGLTSEQKALLGCGPFFGTRCDDGSGFRDIQELEGCTIQGRRPDNPFPPTAPQPITACPGAQGGFFARVFPALCTLQVDAIFSGPLALRNDVCNYSAGGGIDLLNIEASALFQSWPGFEGTPQDYITHSLAPAPGTVKFNGGPVCTRYVPGRSEPVKLPGCRGIADYTITSTDNPGMLPTITGVMFTFENDYDPMVDGCLVGPQMVVTPQLARGTAARQGAQVVPVMTQLQNGGAVPNIAACNGRATNLAGDFAGSVMSTVDAVNQTTGAPLALLDEAGGALVITPCEAGVPGELRVNNACLAQIAPYLSKANSDSVRGRYADGGDVRLTHASTLFHPLAGCVSPQKAAFQRGIFGAAQPVRCNTNAYFNILDDVLGGTAGVNVEIGNGPGSFLGADPNLGLSRDLETQFLIGNECVKLLAAGPNPACDLFLRDNGAAQVFQNELAQTSWNFLMFLMIGSTCDPADPELTTDSECFNTADPWRPGKCSVATPHYCSAVKGFFGLAGVQRNTLKAAGNGRYGRRTLLFQSGQEIILDYNKRNVFGFSTDFSEDRTKSNWGVEFTWIESIPFGDSDEFDGSKNVDTLNLTVSADRPTFINFLNANRTFFFNTQWFFQYIAGYENSMPANGPFNVLFTFAIITGYFQDRLNPSLVTIYDFNSHSGGVLTSVGYRFTEAFSATFGISFFFGHTELVDMPVNPIAPAGNRAGRNAYKDGSDQFISLLRKRDEVSLRLRWTF